jgi:hypothetical protein
MAAQRKKMRVSVVKKRVRRTKAQCAKDPDRVTHALCACGRATDLTNRDLSNLTGLAASRVQVILGRLDAMGVIARHTITFIIDGAFRRARTVYVEALVFHAYFDERQQA